MKQFLFSVFGSCLLTTLLTACGGSSSQDSAISIDTGKTYQNETIIAIDENSKINQAVDLFLYYPNESVTDILWQQTAGEPVTFLTANTKAIAFTPKIAGSYHFEVNFSLNGNAQSLAHTVTVSDDESLISARLGHVVQEGNNVSLRAEVVAQLNSANVRWQQLSGPEVSFTETNLDGDLAIFFDSPTITEDTIAEFQLSLTQDGQTYSDTVAVLIENSQDIAGNAYFEDRLASVYPYNATGKYADNLVACVYANTLSSSCTLRELPLIAQETTMPIIPTIDDIMDRVVISHDWMAERFKQFLENNDKDDDFRQLLQATTAIVISSDIRPSFYWAATGAIYLDADNFWLTADERDTINEAPDYRRDFGSDLQFVMPWRYVKDNEYASESVAATSRQDRNASDGLYRLTSLMYHELTHANDFFPASSWGDLNPNNRILDAADAATTNSDNLAVAYPLQSGQMRSLAQVSFGDGTASDQQKSYFPIDIIDFFSTDQATDFYNYSSEREDYAMLFEEFMMQTRFGVVRDVAITNQPSGDIVTASDYIVHWGQRGRIGEQSITSRLSFVASRVLPGFNADESIAALPEPIEMSTDISWLENLAISPVSDLSNNRTNAAKYQTFAQSLEHLSLKQTARPELIRPLPYYQKPLPKH